MLLGYELIIEAFRGNHNADFQKWEVRVRMEEGQPPTTIYAVPTRTEHTKKEKPRQPPEVRWDETDKDGTKGRKRDRICPRNEGDDETTRYE